MSEASAGPEGPDLSAGIPLAQLPDGSLLAGHVGGSAVLLARVGDEIFAIGAHCTHYGAPLAHGLLVGDTVHCPWHHACFSLRSGEAVKAPALKPVSRWMVELRDGMCFVKSEIPAGDGASALRQPGGQVPTSVLIVGAGAAGNAAAEMLRREGYQGPVTMIGADEAMPYDRPNLSKDYLAGNAPEEWIPLRDEVFYRAHNISLILGKSVTALNLDQRRLSLNDGSTHDFGALLLATGAEPRRLPALVDGAGRARYLRSLADCRAIITAAEGARRAVVIGASFIGLEVAAALRARGLDVHVVAPDELPLVKVMGQHLATYIRRLHESHGVTFHLGKSVALIDTQAVTLSDGTTIEAELVVAGIGVTPRDQLAASAGLAVENGVRVDEFLETAVPGVFAAGDIARYPDARTGQPMRIEHWVVAERQGQTAARNILGARERYTDPPFFWSRHYDVSICYVGHATRWSEERVSGNASDQDCAVTFLDGGGLLAVATIGRDIESLRAEVEMAQSH